MYEMTSLPDILLFVCLTIFQLYSASTNPIVPGGRGRTEGQGTGRVGNFVAEPMK